MAKIISVSVSEEFYNLMTEYNISPTEAFRVGLAVFFCDLGISPYKNEKNEIRSLKTKKFLEKIDEARKNGLLHEFSIKINELEFLIKKIKDGN